ncbi:MAG: hypothetical protein CVV44_01930 [Spirochaetae bacterium HGW-Spirochaetae-1]|jgi:hypothetical protein|nr:MAG: hypothetical protein CVV44_01930 [Spirochaetae bacterium HGW-Spirochaetae-1]
MNFLFSIFAYTDGPHADTGGHVAGSKLKGLLFGFLLVAFIIIFEIICARLALPAWPAFMVMIFFFVVHEDIKMIPPILTGGAAGIACVFLIEKFVGLLGPSLGHEAAKLAFIGIFVYSIVMLKDRIPWVFNSFAFMFFLVSSLAGHSSGVNVPVWIGIEVILGGIFIAGILGINWIVDVLIRGFRGQEEVSGQ